MRADLPRGSGESGPSPLSPPARGEGRYIAFDGLSEAPRPDSRVRFPKGKTHPTTGNEVKIGGR